MREKLHKNAYFGRLGGVYDKTDHPEKQFSKKMPNLLSLCLVCLQSLMSNQ